MPVLHVTSLTAAILALGLVALSLPITFHRRRAKISLGVGEDKALQNLVRAQGNYTEYAPLGLILIGLLEYAGAPAAYLWWLASALMVGRVVHAVGMLTTTVPARVIGMMLTYGMLIIAAVNLIGRHPI